MSDEPIKTNAEIVAEKLAKNDAKQPPRPAEQTTVFQWLLDEVGSMESAIRIATKANKISTDAAKIVFKECVRMMVETQAGEMQRQREADAAYQDAAFSSRRFERKN